jgi:hypothetical protein
MINDGGQLLMDLKEHRLPGHFVGGHGFVNDHQRAQHLADR